ncbi:inverse autotransporter beta domain-containing protein [Citrobacter amalonaticus]|nr:inverse autotransporter beta domain-containing protein [Citrobacter amalonaticus]MCO4157550.1 inverse autotransporter beta domain-containing protein [Citrobacter amalonaticus]
MQLGIDDSVSLKNTEFDLLLPVWEQKSTLLYTQFTWNLPSGSNVSDYLRAVGQGGRLVVRVVSFTSVASSCTKKVKITATSKSPGKVTPKYTFTIDSWFKLRRMMDFHGVQEVRIAPAQERQCQVPRNGKVVCMFVGWVACGQNGGT